MSDQIKQIAERLRGLRDVLELTSQEVAESCQLTVVRKIYRSALCRRLPANMVSHWMC